MKFNLVKKLITSTFFIVAITPASAAFTCVADVTGVLIYGDGSINVKHSGRNAWTFICNLKTERQGVSIATCAMWVSTLQNAKKENKKLRFYYPTGASYNSCAALPIYGAAPAPVYIGDNI